MEFIIFVLLFVLALFVFIFGRAITKKERQASELPQNKDLFTQACKAAKDKKKTTGLTPCFATLNLLMKTYQPFPDVLKKKSTIEEYRTNSI